MWQASVAHCHEVCVSQSHCSGLVLQILVVSARALYSALWQAVTAQFLPRALFASSQFISTNLDDWVLANPWVLWMYACSFREVARWRLARS
jgi:hypothetical protein